MTRFLYIADTHFGANPMGYFQQSPYPEKLPELLAELIKAEKPDFILHGGDMIDAVTPENLRRARETFSLPVPVWLCLGNHDMSAAASLNPADAWLAEAPDFFRGNALCFRLQTDQAVLHIVPNHWQTDAPWRWKNKQEPCFMDQQLQWLRDGLRQEPEKCHLLFTHSPVFGLPPEQTGRKAAVHAGDPDFVAVILNLTTEFPHLRAVFSAHTHMNACISYNETHFITVSSLVESPFEYKVVELDESVLRLRTESLFSRVSFRADYDFNRTYVQGREPDRMLEINLNLPVPKR